MSFAVRPELFAASFSRRHAPTGSMDNSHLQPAWHPLNNRGLLFKQAEPLLRTTGQERHVLTTRNDGHITFLVDDLGQYLIDTKHGR
jgi:hypothetical protein